MLLGAEQNNISSYLNTGDENVLVDTPMEPDTVTPISQRRRQHLSDRLVELNKEFEQTDSQTNDSVYNNDNDTNYYNTQEYLLERS